MASDRGFGTGYWTNGGRDKKTINYTEKSIQIQEKNIDNETISLCPTTLMENIGINFYDYALSVYKPFLEDFYTQEEIEEFIIDEWKINKNDYCPLEILLKSIKENLE